MSDVLVSVVVPTYNQKEFVCETLDSVLAQTYENFEIIVTDDGSTDGTAELIKQYAVRFPNKIKPIFSEKNTGIAANLNRALEVICGDLVAWLGGDDVMLPDKLKNQVEVLMSSPGAAGCCHDAIVFDSWSSRNLGLFSELYNKKKGLRAGGVELWLDANYYMLPSAVMIWSKYIPAHGFDSRLKYANDWLFDIEVFRHGKCVPLDEPLVKYRRHQRNVTDSASLRESVLEEGLLVLGIVDARYPELHSLVKQRRIALFLAESLRSFRKGNRHRYKSYIWAAIKEGALVRGMLVAAAVRILGNAMLQGSGFEVMYKSNLLSRMSRFIKGGL